MAKNQHYALLEELTHTTVRINCDLPNHSSSTGTGYIYSFLEDENDQGVLCVVTNKHVINGAIRAHFNLTKMKTPGVPDYGNHETITIEDIQALAIPHPGDVDLTAIPLLPILMRTANEGTQFYFKCLDKSSTVSEKFLEGVSPVEQIMMIGYPIGLWDKTNNLPIVRRGITATHLMRKFNGANEFLIDCACFPGSSGSPVFLANIGSYIDQKGTLVAGCQFSLIGTLYAGPQFNAEGVIEYTTLPTQVTPKITSQIPTNLGLVIQASELFKLESEISKTIDNLRPSRNSPCRCGSGKKFKFCCGQLT